MADTLLTAFKRLDQATLLRVGENALRQQAECANEGAHAWADVWSAVAITADQALSSKTTG